MYTDNSFMKHPAHNYILYINLQQLGEGGSCNIYLLYIILVSMSHDIQ